MRTTAPAFWMCALLVSFAVPGARAAEKIGAAKVPEAATVGGNYSELLKIVPVPGDEATFGKFCDYGYDSSTEWGGHTNLPSGFWVYVAPNWYIWKDSKRGQPPARALVAGDEFTEWVGHEVRIEMANTSIKGTITANGVQFLTVQMTSPRPTKLLVNKAQMIYVVVEEGTRGK